MPRVYLDQDLSEGCEVPLTANAQHHVTRVLRLGVGAGVVVFDGRGHQFLGRLATLDRCQATVVIEGPMDALVESPLSVTLIQAISRAERMDYSLQKAVELGATCIAPVLTRRCQPLPSGPRAARRVAHWRGVIVAACEQCGRSTLPELLEPALLATRLQQLPAAQYQCYLLNPANGTKLRSQCLPVRPIALLIGPEGGLEQDEIDLAHSVGFESLSLGPRILRTETAGLAALAAFQTLWGDLG